MKENNLKSHLVDINKMLSCYSTNEENYSFLLRLIRRNVVIPFLGAGFSANFGYPVWGKFLSEQAKKYKLEEVQLEIEQGNNERAASKLKEKLDASMEYILTQVFGDHVYKRMEGNREIELLPNIFRNLILTTNFDEAIEMLYSRVNGEYIEKLTPKTLKDVNVIYRRIACGEPTLIKLHGDVATKEFVLTEEEYNNIYGAKVLDMRRPLPAFLRDILLSRVILFLGCSLTEDRTLQVIEQAQIDGSISFALLELPIETENKEDPWNPIVEVNGSEVSKFSQRQKFLRTHNIIPIWYPHGKYEALNILLSDICNETGMGNKYSTTVANNKVRHLISEGEIQSKNENILHAFSLFSEAESIIAENRYKFTKEMQLAKLKRIHKFYNERGFAYEKRNVQKEIISLIKQTNSPHCIELAMFYHSLGYTYELYQYYKLQLRMMQQSQKILQKYKDDCESEWHQDSTVSRYSQMEFDNAAAFIYISLGYAYLKNNQKETAKEWYQKAQQLIYSNNLHKENHAFVCNGLFRYFLLQGEKTEAINTLDEALALRRSCFDEKYYDRPQHILNTHSNKIRLYLQYGQIEEAEQEYNDCMNEDNIWERLQEFPGAKRRILTDYGDILAAKGTYLEAYEKYQEALCHRKYLHLPDEFIVSDLYLKMAQTLVHMPEYEEKSMEYYIQAYVIKEKILSEYAAPKVLEDIKVQMRALSDRLSLSPTALEQRLTVQKKLLEYRYDDRIDKRQDELIKYFEL